MVVLTPNLQKQRQLMLLDCAPPTHRERYRSRTAAAEKLSPDLQGTLSALPIILAARRRGWPTERAGDRQVFGATDEILRSGRPQQDL
jgi:hypothetical protein